MAIGKGVKFSITATDKTRSAFSRTQNNIKKTQGLQRSWNAGLNSNRRAVQQFGFQMSDFAVQVAGGQSAMLAFTQQGGQMLQFFGPAGAIMAAFLAVFGSLAIAFTRSGKALNDLLPALGVLREDFAAIGRVLGVVKEALIDFANVVVNNLDRILITAGLVAGFFAGRFVLAFVAARIAVIKTAGALTVLRGALIRTGIGALIIGAGELVYQFTRLVKATRDLVRGAGGVGNALVLLGNVAVEVWNKIGSGVSFVSSLFVSLGRSMQTAFLRALAVMVDKFAEFTQHIADGLNSLFNLNLKGLGGGLAADLNNTADAAEKVGVKYAKMAKDAAAAFRAPFKSIQALRDAMKAADEEGKQIDVRDWFGGGDANAGGGGGGGSGKSPVDKLSDMAKKIKSIFDDMSKSISGALNTAFKGLLDRTKTVSERIQDFAVTIISKLTEIMLAPVWENIGNNMAKILLGAPGNTGFSGGLFSGIFSKLFGIQSFAGGGSTGSGQRVGGVDGKGGRMAIVHPNETVVDHTRSNSGVGGTTNLQVVIHENARDEKTEVKQSPGRVDVFMRKMVTDTVSSGGLDGVMKARFGVQPKVLGGV